jgi:hypothetical protein
MSAGTVERSGGPQMARTTARGWPAGLAKPVAIRYVFYGIFLTEANP